MQYKNGLTTNIYREYTSKEYCNSFLTMRSIKYCMIKEMAMNVKIWDMKLSH